MVQLPVYMDYHATTPCDAQVLQAMMPYFSGQFGNASSKGHLYGWQASEAVNIAREQLAALIHAEPGEIIFTSGATESINLALKGVFEAYSGKGKHIITAATEHRAVLDTCVHLEKLGAEVSYLPVLPDGLIDLHLLENSIRPDTILIALMIANNETGVLLPVKAIGEIARQHAVPFFTDATQALGKIPIDVMDDGIDLLAVSAHKLYGPKGTGALYVRRKNPRIRLISQLDGGQQERGLRSGTLNVPGIVGFGSAAALAQETMELNRKNIGVLRNRLEQGLLALDGARLNGHPLERLPTVTNISFEGIGGGHFLAVLQKEMAISAGSACSSGSPQPSHVLKAMGLNDDQAHHALRFSLGKYNTADEVEFVIEKVAASLKEVSELKEKIRSDGELRSNEEIRSFIES